MGVDKCAVWGDQGRETAAATLEVCGEVGAVWCTPVHTMEGGSSIEVQCEVQCGCRFPSTTTTSCTAAVTPGPVAGEPRVAGWRRRRCRGEGCRAYSNSGGEGFLNFCKFRGEEWRVKGSTG